MAKVTKKTIARNIQKFSDMSLESWNAFNKFVDSHWRSKKKREVVLDELCEIVDKYVELNCRILMWCQKNGVDPVQFMCDVENYGFNEISGEK